VAPTDAELKTLFISAFQDSTASYLIAGEIDKVMDFYSSDYINGEVTRADRETFFRNTTWTDTVIVNVSVDITRVNGGYRVSITDIDAEVDTTWVDFAEKRGTTFYWVGNPPPTEADFIADFSAQAVSLLRANEIDELLTFYASDYLNELKTYAEMEEFYRSIEWSPTVEVEVIPRIARDDGSYYITIADAGETYEWTDFVGKRGDKFLWIGDQVTPKQIVLVEAFTGLDCQYCPNASQKLQEIHEIYPDKFIYIEYFSKTGDYLRLYNRFERERNYWGGVPSEPFTVFHGEQTLLGGTSIVLVNYQPYITSLIDKDATIFLKDLQGSREGDTISGSVKIIINETNTEHLYLHYAIYEEYVQSRAFNYAPTIPVSHAVRARDYKPLVNPQSEEIRSFSFQIPPSNTFPVDDDLVLVVWVQRKQNDAVYVPGDKVFYAVKRALY